ncbi:hypothetical protein SO694_00081053 [Aureococcus anophagefferens]|uniref:Uncharacterized protein n=1 Tax=Aureococcus anophagefferens TaxID=44056 RepID=A0ABR1G4C9_AURAN
MRLHLLVVAACAGAFPTYVSREKDGAEAVPPKPAYYAHKDRSSRDRFAAVAAGAAPKNFTTLEALAYAQFRSPICHSVAHALGRRVYAEARGAFATPADRLDAALAACEYRCTGGCLHGAVAAYAVATPATVDIPQTCARASMRRILPFGECAHAAGHALALTLSEGAAFAACEAQRRDPSVAHYCAGGVIMELGDGFFGGARAVGDRCGGLPASARASCFYYGLRKEALRDRDLAKVLRRRCPAPPAGGDRGAYRSCVYGAASGLVKDGMTGDLGARGAKSCERHVPAADRPHCVDGLMFRTAKYGKAGMVAATCAAFADADLAALCRDVADAGMYTRRKDALMRDYMDEGEGG